MSPSRPCVPFSEPSPNRCHNTGCFPLSFIFLPGPVVVLVHDELSDHIGRPPAVVLLVRAETVDDEALPFAAVDKGLARKGIDGDFGQDPGHKLLQTLRVAARPALEESTDQPL